MCNFIKCNLLNVALLQLYISNCCCKCIITLKLINFSILPACSIIVTNEKLLGINSQHSDPYWWSRVSDTSSSCGTEVRTGTWGFRREKRFSLFPPIYNKIKVIDKNGNRIVLSIVLKMTQGSLAACVTSSRKLNFAGSFLVMK